MRLAVGNVCSVVPGRKRNKSHADNHLGIVGSNSRSPTLEVNPKACPISCVATASKSMVLALMPSLGSKSNFPFDFDPSDGISANTIDFDAVATHEIGHALGFTSNVGDRELDPTIPRWLSAWDLFRFRPGTTLQTFPTASRILSSGGTQVFFAGTSDLGLSTGRQDSSGGDGEQASHWKAQSQTGILIGI